MDELELYHQNNLLYTQESLLRYTKGGYHPVSLGDPLDSDRYRIHHKLGWGSFSTVWLAEDTERAQWVSIKIITADATAHSHELDVIQKLKKLCPQGLSSRHIIQLLNNFVHHGPNGTHQCLVFELLGPALETINPTSNFYNLFDERLDSEVVLRISEQVLDGVAFIHSSGYAHGDICDHNIAFTCSGLAQATKEDLFAILGEPKTEELKRLDGTPLSPNLPRQLFKAAEWDRWTNEDEEDIRILDFGEAIRTAPKRRTQPGNLQPPETFFAECFDLTSANDLWRTGIVIYSYVVGGVSFSYWGNRAQMMRQMIEFAGSLPAEWDGKWQKTIAASESPLTDVVLGEVTGLEQMFQTKVPEKELQGLLPVIQGLMKLRPSERMSASMALELVRALRTEHDEKSTYGEEHTSTRQPYDIK